MLLTRLLLLPLLFNLSAEIAFSEEFDGSSPIFFDQFESHLGSFKHRFINIPEGSFGKRKYKEVPVTSLGGGKVKVVFKYRALIEKDFGEFYPSMKFWSNEKMDEWLISHFAIMADTQLQSEHGQALSDAFYTKDKSSLKVKAYRPIDYGRALVVRIEDPKGRELPLVDVKGSGAEAPSNLFYEQEIAKQFQHIFVEGVISHSNGLLNLTEGIHEYFMEKAANMVLEHSKQNGVKFEYPVYTIPSYAVLDLGVDIRFSKSIRMPSGLILRRSHLRGGKIGTISGAAITSNKMLYPHESEVSHKNYFSKNLSHVIKLERNFLRYGLATGSYRKTKHSFCGHRYVSNLQFSTGGGLLDFSSYRFVKNIPRLPIAIDDRLHYRSMSTGDFVDMEDNFLIYYQYPANTGDWNTSFLFEKEYLKDINRKIWLSKEIDKKQKMDARQLGAFPTLSKKIVELSRKVSQKSAISIVLQSVQKKDVTGNPWSNNFANKLQCALLSEIKEHLGLPDSLEKASSYSYAICSPDERKEGNQIVRQLIF